MVVDYELSLSDTASLASLEEYDDPNASDLTLARAPLNGYRDDFDVEDDAVTVSSRDTTSISCGVPALRIAAQQNLRSLFPVISDDSPPSFSPCLACFQSRQYPEIQTPSYMRRGLRKFLLAILHFNRTHVENITIRTHPRQALLRSKRRHLIT